MNFYDAIASTLHVSRAYAKRTWYEIVFGIERDPWLRHLFMDAVADEGVRAR